MAPPRPAASLLLRYLAYMAVVGLILAGYVALIAGAIDPEDILDENRWIEYAQIGLLALIVLFCLSAFRSGGSVLHRLFAGLALFAIFREMDSLLRDLMFDGVHNIAMALVLVAMGSMAWINRQRFKVEAVEFMGRPGFHLMIFGAVLVVIFAQLLGQREVWERLAEDMTSEAKRFIEEGLEMMGYVMIVCGVFEERFFGNRTGPSSQT
ncbi:hypothetical protein IIC65_07865 [Candidatus Sumerlaeota bacterium]|nr:hypothetical protein [Candidatus Sumerlaeota bacterium]